MKGDTEASLVRDTVEMEFLYWGHREGVLRRRDDIEKEARVL